MIERDVLTLPCKKGFISGFTGFLRENQHSSVGTHWRSARKTKGDLNGSATSRISRKKKSLERFQQVASVKPEQSTRNGSSAFTQTPFAYSRWQFVKGVSQNLAQFEKRYLKTLNFLKMQWKHEACKPTLLNQHDTDTQIFFKNTSI